MKKLVIMAAMICGAFVISAATLAEANKNISAAISDAAVMQKTMSSLSKADQVKFVAAVNKSIAKMPGSVEQRTAMYLAANEAAIKAAAATGNLLPVLSETFATVPPSSLAALSESFADTFFNRALDSSKTYTDAQVARSSGKVLSAIHERTAAADATDSRDALAIAMLVRASNGTPNDLSEQLINGIAGDNPSPQLTSMTKAAIVGNYEEVVPADGEDAQIPDKSKIIRMRDPQLQDALAGDLGSGVFEIAGILAEPLTEQIFEISEMTTIEERDKGGAGDTPPVTDNPEAPFNPDPYPGQSR